MDAYTLQHQRFAARPVVRLSPFYRCCSHSACLSFSVSFVPPPPVPLVRPLFRASFVPSFPLSALDFSGSVAFAPLFLSLCFSSFSCRIQTASSAQAWPLVSLRSPLLLTPLRSLRLRARQVFDAASPTSCDICVYDPHNEAKDALVAHYCMQDARCAPLIRLVKFWAGRRGIGYAYAHTASRCV